MVGSRDGEGRSLGLWAKRLLMSSSASRALVTGPWEWRGGKKGREKRLQKMWGWRRPSLPFLNIWGNVRSRFTDCRKWTNRERDVENRGRRSPKSNVWKEIKGLGSREESKDGPWKMLRCLSSWTWEEGTRQGQEHLWNSEKVHFRVSHHWNWMLNSPLINWAGK